MGGEGGAVCGVGTSGVGRRDRWAGWRDWWVWRHGGPSGWHVGRVEQRGGAGGADRQRAGQTNIVRGGRTSCRGGRALWLRGRATIANIPGHEGRDHPPPRPCWSKKEGALNKTVAAEERSSSSSSSTAVEEGGPSSPSSPSSSSIAVVVEKDDNASSSSITQKKRTFLLLRFVLVSSNRHNICT